MCPKKVKISQEELEASNLKSSIKNLRELYAKILPQYFMRLGNELN